MCRSHQGGGVASYARRPTGNEESSTGGAARHPCGAWAQRSDRSRRHFSGECLPTWACRYLLGRRESKWTPPPSDSSLLLALVSEPCERARLVYGVLQLHRAVGFITGGCGRRRSSLRPLEAYLCDVVHRRVEENRHLQVCHCVLVDRTPTRTTRLCTCSSSQRVPHRYFTHRTRMAQVVCLGLSKVVCHHSVMSHMLPHLLQNTYA